MASPSLMIKSDIVKEFAKYNKNTEKNFLHMSKVRTAMDKKHEVTFLAEMCTGGVVVNEFGEGKKKKTNFSVGVTITENSPNAFNLNLLCDLARKEANKIWGEGKGTFYEPIKDDDKLFIKIKTDAQNKHFLSKFNIPITPKKYAQTKDFDQFMFDGEAQIWFHFADEKYGITIAADNFTKGDFIKNEEDDE